MFKPLNIDSYVGQEQIKKNLKIILTAQKAKSFTDAPMAHVLLSGPAGLGKTTLAEIIASELHRPVCKFMGPHLKDIDQLNIIKEAARWSLLFIDEIHSLPLKIEESLYEVMDSFTFRGKELNPITVIGATTKEGTLSKPLRSRFVITERLQMYTVAELSQVLKQSAATIKVDISDDAIREIARRSRGIPRVANHLLKRVSYYGADITLDTAQNALDSIGIDSNGLELLDRQILIAVRDNFDGGPVGIDSIANVVGEDDSTVESREEYLSYIGLLRRTGRGRILSDVGKKYLEV